MQGLDAWQALPHLIKLVVMQTTIQTAFVSAHCVVVGHMYRNSPRRFFEWKSGKREAARSEACALSEERWKRNGGQIPLCYSSNASPSDLQLKCFAIERLRKSAFLQQMFVDFREWCFEVVQTKVSKFLKPKARSELILNLCCTYCLVICDL